MSSETLEAHGAHAHADEYSHAHQFDDPESFDVRRDPNPHVGFGGPGPHFCLGAHLARRELSVVFRHLLTRLPDIEVSGDVAPLEALGIPLVGGIKRLPVRFTPTAPVGR